jgi:hypothetical protein
MFFKCSFTLPADQARILGNVAKRVGCSQSAVLQVLLEMSLPQLAAGLGEDVDPDTPPRRLTGPDGDLIRDCIMQALDAGHQMRLSL